eukprot:2728815-Rhodomonas_salina.2
MSWYAMPGTDLAYRSLRCPVLCDTMPDADLAYRAYQLSVNNTQPDTITAELLPPMAVSLADGAGYACGWQSPVLTRRMVVQAGRSLKSQPRMPLWSPPRSTPGRLLRARYAQSGTDMR